MMEVSKKCCLGEMVVVAALGTADAKWCPDGNARQDRDASVWPRAPSG